MTARARTSAPERPRLQRSPEERRADGGFFDYDPLMVDEARAGGFAERDWSRIEALDRRYWIEEYRRHGAAATVGASVALWRHMRRLRPDWPNDEERRRDLEHHVSLKRLLERASRDLAAR